MLAVFCLLLFKDAGLIVTLFQSHILSIYSLDSLHPLAIFALNFVSFIFYCIIYCSVQQEEKRLTTKEELEDARLSRHKLEQYVISYSV